MDQQNGENNNNDKVSWSFGESQLTRHADDRRDLWSERTPKNKSRNSDLVPLAGQHPDRETLLSPSQSPHVGCDPKMFESGDPVGDCTRKAKRRASSFGRDALNG